ncbi:MAG: hypothetical protein U5K74_15335 [Gemmatimonadaceae bacterium]|nr:hypothetical protein [Gemmatimonadaceae bacterium]
MAHGAPERVRVFGGVLAADRPLPGLPVALPGDGHSSFWELRTSDAAATPVGHSADARVIGRQTFANGIEVTLATGGTCDEIAISDTGRFVIEAAARCIDTPPHRTWIVAPWHST